MMRGKLVRQRKGQFFPWWRRLRSGYFPAKRWDFWAPWPVSPGPLEIVD
jgi:hypothetical protein